MADGTLVPIPPNLNVTFNYAYSLINAICNDMSTIVVTTAANSSGGLTVGNAFVTGILGATTIATNILKGGNVAGSANLSLISNVVAINTISISCGNTVANATTLKGDNLSIALNGFAANSFWTNNLFFSTFGGGNSTVASNLALTSNLVASATVGLFVGNTVANATTLKGDNLSITANGFVNTNFWTTTFKCFNLAGGNSSVASSINISSNLVAQTATSFFCGNTVANSTTIKADNIISTFFSNTLVVGSNTAIFDNYALTSGLTAQAIDTFQTTSLRSLEYLFSITDTVANNYQATKLLLLQDGTNAWTTEYGTLLSNNQVGRFSANISGTTVSIWITPITSTAIAVKMTRHSLSV